MTETWELSCILVKSPAEIRNEFEPQSKVNLNLYPQLMLKLNVGSQKSIH